tara:strand:+ start:2681 stop:3856 length:1176 start_codon:yes stop_codon:yes gene_type:complete
MSGVTFNFSSKRQKKTRTQQRAESRANKFYEGMTDEEKFAADAMKQAAAERNRQPPFVRFTEKNPPLKFPKRYKAKATAKIRKAGSNFIGKGKIKNRDPNFVVPDDLGPNLDKDKVIDDDDRHFADINVHPNKRGIKVGMDLVKEITTKGGMKKITNEIHKANEGYRKGDASKHPPFTTFPQPLRNLDALNQETHLYICAKRCERDAGQEKTKGGLYHVKTEGTGGNRGLANHKAPLQVCAIKCKTYSQDNKKFKTFQKTRDYKSEIAKQNKNFNNTLRAHKKTKSKSYTKEIERIEAEDKNRNELTSPEIKQEIKQEYNFSTTNKTFNTRREALRSIKNIGRARRQLEKLQNQGKKPPVKSPKKIKIKGKPDKSLTDKNKSVIRGFQLKF